MGRADTSAAELLVLARAEGAWGNAAAARALLQGRPWLDREGGGEGWQTLAMAAEWMEAWGEAAAAWERYAAVSAPGAGEATLRRIRALAHAEDGGGAVTLLEALPATSDPRHPVVLPWLALEVARSGARTGDTATVRRALARAGGEARARGELLPAAAHLQAGDSVGALGLWRRVAGQSASPVRRSEAAAQAGAVALARGDTAAAVQDLRRALEGTGTGAGARRAAVALLESGVPATAPELRRMATLLGGAGDGARALVAWDRLESARGGLEPADRLARARLRVAAGRGAAAAGELTTLAGGSDPSVAAPALDLLVRLRRDEGAGAEARRLEDRLVAAFPSSPQALDVVFFRGDAAHDRGEHREAAAHYREASGMIPTHDRAGLARMRWGQLQLTLGSPEAALSVFEGYLGDFPTGRRWDEAAYWSGRIRSEGGDSAGAAALFRRIRREDPLGYHALLSHRREGTPFEPELVEGPVPQGTRPQWMQEGLDDLRLLAALGMEEGARVRRQEMEARAAGSVAEVLLLGEGLHEIGFHFDGVNVGWEARRLGHPWDLRLARIIYPFPHRELIFREARERGLDPWLVAAVIRQESAFSPEAVSPAGAVGLMQVLPTSGSDLAREARLAPFTSRHLRVPEVNVLLGTWFLADLLERYEGFLPLALSGYNAGPSRAARWRDFPEAADTERFVERIPFAETRGYVRNVTRNAAVYRWLHP